MRHKTHEKRRQKKNIRNEMKSLVHQRKRLIRLPENEREEKRRKIDRRMEQLEEKFDQLC